MTKWKQVQQPFQDIKTKWSGQDCLTNIVKPHTDQLSQYSWASDIVTHTGGTKTSKMFGVEAAPENQTNEPPENLHLTPNVLRLVISLIRGKNSVF